MVTPVRRIMIAGGGNIGLRLAKCLEKRYEIKIIEGRKERAELLAGELDDALVLLGDATDEELLERENIVEMDLFLAVTNDDEDNIMSALLAKRMGKTRIIAHVPSRGLIGYQGQFLTDTRGTGVLNRIFHGWTPHKGPIQGRRQGVLISMENGVSVSYALWNLEERGRMFIGPQEQVYTGMIIGEHSRDNDLEVNPLKGKKLTNVRASGTDEAVRLTPHIKMSLEEAIAYIDDDELVEVTPKSIRLRKVHLDPHERKRASRAKAA